MQKNKKEKSERGRLVVVDAEKVTNHHIIDYYSSYLTVQSNWLFNKLCGILMHNYGGLANCLTISTFGKQGVCVMRQCGPITHFITHLIFTRSVMWQRVYGEYVIKKMSIILIKKKRKKKKRMSIIVHYSFMSCVKVLLITIFFGSF